MENIVKYPVGQQSFQVLIEDNCLYVDKSHFIEKLLSKGNRYYFLARPRRFGKSLFLSMLKSFFEGKRHLFKGLYADGMDWDWQPHPVFYLDLNQESYYNRISLSQVLEDAVSQWEKTYGVTPQTDNHSIRFKNVIEAAHEKTGKQVVILVDEYDKPLVNNLHQEEMFNHFRSELSAIYSNFKSRADHIRMVFITGVSRFAHLSVFSGLNNITDLSFLSEFAPICGITEKELTDNFQKGIEALADKFGISQQEVHRQLKQRYDGYHFSEECPDIYNPFSLLNVMENKKYMNYWIKSGMPTLLEQLLKNNNADLKELFEARCDQSMLEGLDFDNPNPLALLYQTGYLTIKDYDSDIYTLGLPNEEVKAGFLEFLLPRYAHIKEPSTAFFISEFVNELRQGRADDFMKRMQSMFAAVPYGMALDNERNLHNALLMLVMLLGIKVHAEYATSDGRIDMLMATDKYLYLIELKIDKTAREALDQINAKNYALSFAADGRRVVKIGVNFSTATRTITDWAIEM